MTYTVQSQVGLKYTVIGTGETYEQAKALADAKVAMMVGKVLSATRSEDIDPAEWQEPVPAGNHAHRAVITLFRGYPSPKKTIEIDQATTEIADQLVQDGRVNLKHELVQRLARAYRDGDGNNDYVPVKGEFLKRGQKSRLK